MLETKLHLEDSTIDALQTLIQANLDSAKVLSEASEAIDHAPLTFDFSRIAKIRESHARELRTFVAANGEEPEDDAGVMGSLHATWIQFRAAINGGDPKVVLIEAERAEDRIKEQYEELLKETAGSAMNDVMTRQYAEVKGHHDAIRDLRDALLD